jgi:hypothetical protein
VCGQGVKVSERAVRARVAPSAIRRYQSVGILLPAARQANGYREYADEDLARLLLVPACAGSGSVPSGSVSSGSVPSTGRRARLCLEHRKVDRDLRRACVLVAFRGGSQG